MPFRLLQPAETATPISPTDSAANSAANLPTPNFRMLQPARSLASGIIPSAPAVPDSSFMTDWLGIKNPDTYVSDALKQVSETIQHPIEAIKSAVGAGVASLGGALSGLGEATSQAFAPETQGVAQRTANIAHLGASVAGVVFSPISVAFSAAEKLPVLKEAADVLSAPFAFTGKIGDLAGEKFVDVLPIDQQSKNILKPAFGEVGALAGQILLGGKIMDLIVKGVKLDKTAIDTATREAKQETIVAKDIAMPEVSQTLQPLAQEAPFAKQIAEIKAKYPNTSEGLKAGEEEFVKATKTSQEFGFVGEKYIQVDLPLKDIQGRMVNYMEYRDIAERGGLPSAGRQIKTPIKITAENIGDLQNTKVDIIDGNQRLRQAITNGDTTIPAKVFVKPSQLTDLYNQATKAPTVPETKISGVAKNIEAKAVEKGLIDKGYADLAGYDASTVKLQAEMISKYNIEDAIKMTETGELPAGMKPDTPLSVVEDYFTAKGDGEALLKLAKSPLASQISEAGSALSLTKGRGLDSAVGAIKDIADIKTKAVERKMGDIKTEKAKIVKEAKVKTWSEYVKSLSC